MSRTGGLATAPAEPFYLRPWVVLLTGLGLVGVALVLTTLDGRAASIVRAWLIVAGLLTAGAAISRRLQTAGWDLEERLESAGLIAVGAFVALVAYLAVFKEVKDSEGKVINPGDGWGSAEFFLIGLIVIALAGAALVALPALARKVVLSGLILFHFAGIFVAGANVAPGGYGQPPWLTEQLWTRVYRYPLGYVYMTNAYHFYSPDPGPSTLTWFRLQYSDDSYRWIKLPNKKDSLLPLQYTRLMVVADSTKLGGNAPSDNLFIARNKERIQQGMFFRPEPTKDDPQPKAVPIPITLYDYYGINMRAPQEAYKEPSEYCKRLISSYVRYVAKTYPSEKDPTLAVKNVKVYSLTHRLIPASDVAKDHTPFEEIYLYPYYMGTFDKEGEFLIPQQQYDEAGNPVFTKTPYDGFLYWVIPVLAVPKGKPSGNFIFPVDPKEYTVRNYLYLHAGDIRSFDDGKKDEPEKEEGHR